MLNRNKLQEENERYFSEAEWPIGYFSNNNLLFLRKGEMKVQADDFVTEQRRLKEKLSRTRCGKIMEIIGGEKVFDHTSYTNIRKTGNKAKDKEIFDSQLSFLQPNVIITFSEAVKDVVGVSNMMRMEKIDDNWYYSMPAVDKITEEHLERCINDLEEHLQMKAIVRVGDDQIYYISRTGKIRRYFNHKDSNFHFVPTEEETQYKSIYDENLKKKNGWGGKVNTYEGHLDDADIWYYDNINDLRHSTFIPYITYDIETDRSLDAENAPNRILTISFYSSLKDQYYCFMLENDNFDISVVHERYPNAEVTQFESEQHMLKVFIYDVLASDYSIAQIGWNVANFDLKYILNRADNVGVNVDTFLGQNSYRNKYTYFGKVAVIDAMDYCQNNIFYIKPSDYQLETVYQFLFDDDTGKIKEGGVRDMWNNNSGDLVLYNIRDVEMTQKIIEEVRLFEYVSLIQDVAPQDIENIFFNSRIIENILHHRYWPDDVYLPTKREHDKEHFQGAIVFEPIEGKYENACVFDFSSMYTTVYISFNISPETYVGSLKEVKENIEQKKEEFGFEEVGNLIKIENDFETSCFLPHHVKTGILPKLQKELLDKRNEIKAQRDQYDSDSIDYQMLDEFQGVFKRILNTIYGVTSYAKFILFNQYVSSSITAAARSMLEYSSEIADEYDYKTIYGDTDSIFIQVDGEDLDEVVENAYEFEEVLNDSWDDFMSRFTDAVPPEDILNIELEFEKSYSRLMMTDVKKRYFGFKNFYNGKKIDDPKISVTGFETRRDDTPNYFKEVLLDSYRLFLEDDYREKLQKKYQEVKDNIRDVSVEDLVIKKSLGKDMDEYSNDPMHIRALKREDVEKNKGEAANVVYTDDHEGVTHYHGQDDIRVDYDRYIEKFFKNKMELIDDDMKHVLEGQTKIKRWLR